MHRTSNQNDWVYFCIHDTQLPNGFYQGLMDKGMQFLVQETVDKDGNECRHHFQGLGLVNKSTFLQFM